MLRSFGVMTITNANRLALSVSAIAAMLTGCGGSQALAPPAKVFPDGASASRFIEPESMIAGRSPHKFRGETFSGQGSGIIRCGGGQYHFYEVEFKNRGTAEGPYPGEFTAKGYWQFNSEVSHFFHFHEQFSVVSASHRYSGTVTAGRVVAHKDANCTIANITASYSMPQGWKGSVLVDVKKGKPQLFSESFQ